MVSVAEVCERHANDATALIEILHDLQAAHGFIDPQAHVPELARLLNRSRAEIHGVITFYSDFRTHPPARCSIRVCRGEACQAVGANALHEGLRRVLHGRADVELGEVFCLGNCALGPAVSIDGEVHGRCDVGRIQARLGRRP